MVGRTAANTGRDGPDFSDGGMGWDEPEKPARDAKKLFLVIGLGALSRVATYVGMLELIEANMGELPLVHKLIIGFSVAMLMTMVVWLLDRMFAPIGFFTKLLYTAGYLFLSIISVGFGFGFYWKVLESRSEASRSAEGAISQVQGSLYAAATRLEQLQSTLDQLNCSGTRSRRAVSANTRTCRRAVATSDRATAAGDHAAGFSASAATGWADGTAGDDRAGCSRLAADQGRAAS